VRLEYEACKTSRALVIETLNAERAQRAAAERVLAEVRKLLAGQPNDVARLAREFDAASDPRLR